MNKENYKKYWIIFSIAAFFVLFLMNFSAILGWAKNLIAILTPFTAGIIVAYIVNLPYKCLYERVFSFLGTDNGFKSKLRKPLSLLLAFLFFGAIIAFILGIIIPEISQSINMIVANVDGYLAKTEDLLTKAMGFLGYEYTNFDDLLAPLNDFAKSISGGDFSDLIYSALSKIFPHLYNITMDITSGIYSVVISIVVSVYILAYKDKLLNQLKKVCCAMLPDKALRFTVKVGRTSNEIVGRFFYGQIIDSAIIGVICFVCLSIFGFNYAALISIIVGLTNIIPFFGPIIGAVPSAFLLLLVNPMEAIWFVLFILVMQQLDGNILAPKIVGGTIGINGLWIIFGVIAGGGLFGFIGMILGVPLVAIIYVLVGEGVNKRMSKKNCTVSKHTINMNGEILVTSSSSDKKEALIFFKKDKKIDNKK